MKKIKNIFYNKLTIILFIVVLIIIFLATFIATFLSSENKNKEEKLVLEKIENVSIDDIDSLYDSITDLTCSYSDLYFDIDVRNEKVSVDKLDKKSLTGYLFASLDKSFYLNNDVFDLGIIEKVIDEIFSKDMDLMDYVDGFKYAYSIYSISGRQVTREIIPECKEDRIYVSNLFSYSNDDYMLYLDINSGYVKDGILYDLDDNKLGKFDIYADDSNNILNNMLSNSAYYTYGYIKHDGKYKLDNVAINTRYYEEEEQELIK